MSQETVPKTDQRLKVDTYSLADGRIVFTEAFHLKRGFCCGNGCRHCPFSPRAQKGNRRVAPAFAHAATKQTTGEPV